MGARRWVFSLPPDPEPRLGVGGSVWTTVRSKPSQVGTLVHVATSVLIIDDHPSFRAAARLLLEEDGFEVIGEAADGTEGIAATQALHPDVVLLDVNLPDLDGFEVATRLTSNGHHAKVVMVSSRDPQEFGPLVQRSGARGFIPKADLTGAALTALL
jgi:DNA-binding NarL/FixJ family response regulator